MFDLLWSLWLAASGWGRDIRGRRGSAAIPPNELSREHVYKILQNVAIHAHLKQNVAKCMKMWPFCENPVCPNPVWKPVRWGHTWSLGRRDHGRPEGETGRRTDGQTDGRRDGETERRRDGETERRRDGETERRRDIETERQRDGGNGIGGMGT